MANSELTGIERELVLEYLMDGNVPVTVTPIDTPPLPGGIPAAAAGVFPVALRAEQMTVLDKGIILLRNAPEMVQGFAGHTVRVQFYFNKLGLYFITQMKQISAGLALVIPEKINHVIDEPEESEKQFSVELYYEAGKKSSGMHLDCIPEENYRLFETPRWSDVTEDDAPAAKKYLEKAVMQLRNGSHATGNGVYLIPVCRYLAHVPHEVPAIQDRAVSPSILYIDHERLVFASASKDMILVPETEYAVKIAFPLPSGPIRDRIIYVTGVIEQQYKSDDEKRICAVCRYTSIKEEDTRFLYEKVKKEILR